MYDGVVHLLCSPGTGRHVGALPPSAELHSAGSQVCNLRVFCSTDDPRADARDAGRASGFTLLELMVVIVLVGIAAVAIIPEMKGTYEDALLRSATRHIVDVLHLAYSRAVSMNQVHRVHLQSSGEYSIEAAFRRGPGFEYRPLRDLPGYSGKIDPRIAIRLKKASGEEEVPGSELEPRSERAEQPEDTVQFYPDGTADAMEVHLQDRQGFRVRLELNPVTARVRVSEISRK